MYRIKGGLIMTNGICSGVVKGLTIAVFQN